MNNSFIKPQASYTEWLSQIWPVDTYSREIIIKYCLDKQIRFTEVFTTMGTATLQFSAEDYYKVKDFVNRYSTNTY